MSVSGDDSFGFFVGGATHTCTGEADRDFFKITDLFDEEDTLIDLLRAAGLVEELLTVESIVGADSSLFLRFRAAVVAVTELFAALPSVSSTADERRGR